MVEFPRKVPPVWRELLLIVLFYAAYTVTRIVLSPTGTETAFVHAQEVMRWEDELGINFELTLNGHLLDHERLAFLANLFYLSAHFVVTTGIAVWLYRRRPAHYQWLRGGLMLATAVALVGFWLYPLAPPRFLPSAGFVDPVVFFGTPGLYSSGASTTMANQYAAMPSMHAGWALWCGIALVFLADRWWLRLLGVLYPVTTILVILSTANHYLLDAVIGNMIILSALSATWLLYRWAPVRSHQAQ
ncbi:MAG: phosphatase PAP2 family protein [Streptosporangiaceae bacterium]